MQPFIILTIALLGTSALVAAPSEARRTVIPEPSTWAMMLLGFGAIGFAVRRRKPGMLQRAA